MEKNNKNVFINCPFDRKYKKLFDAIIFTIADCGFIARCSLEVGSNAGIRLRNIAKIMKECRFGVHDISRVELDEQNELPRFNMPFELGIFYGAKEFGNFEQKKKNYIVLEKHPFRYQEFISDLAGFDVESHNNSVKSIIYTIRNWLLPASPGNTLPSAEKIYAHYKKFGKDFREICKKRNISCRKMKFIEFYANICAWLRKNG